MSLITVDRLRKAYREQVAVEDVSFTVEEGEIFGLLGPNGAGKTTTVECLTGLRRRDAGSVSVLGVDPDQHRDLLRQQVGVQLQENALPDKLRVGEALQLFSSFYPDPLDWRFLLDVFGLTDKQNTAYRKLSGGQQQRLSLALALVGNPRVAVLDELTTGLDPAARRAAWEVIEQVRDRGVTIVLVTHFMPEAERLCDRVALVDAGRVVALDTPARLAGAGGEERIRFRPSAPLDDRLLTELPEVSAVRHEGDRLVVSGHGDVIAAVTAMLARHGIIAYQLRVEQASLDDAFVALTGQLTEPDQTDTRSLA